MQLFEPRRRPSPSPAMRLLQLRNYPRLSLVEFAEDEIPRYAILSHTWARDGDEVTYKDIVQGTGSNKLGYEKIFFCAEQAKKDGLEYCWIDTCCIDKTNAAELTESINSMFRWYQKADKCYVFLADVKTPGEGEERNGMLKQSRWFTRGWTLQELIAPTCVEFFSCKKDWLGDRKSLEMQIHQITGIPISALRGDPLSRFTIKERMSWTANRTTKRPEDRVYSLLGIFDIHMEAIYGEGEHHAFRRLQRELEWSENHQLNELIRNQLHVSSTSSNRQSSTSSQGSPTWIVPFERNSRFTGRESELMRIEEMLFGKQPTAKLAITGLGGVGKTQLVIELLYRVADKQKNWSVIWVSAVNMESFHQSYQGIARQLGIPGWQDDKTDVKRLVQTYLSQDSVGQWVLVYDNADDPDMWVTKTGEESHPLLDYIPKSKLGTVVFTTRDRKIAVKLAQQNVVDLRAMGEDAAVELLRKCLINPDILRSNQHASALLSELTFLPLAIVQAASYINENSITLPDYLALLADQEEEVIDLLSEQFEDDGRYRDIKNPVAITWLISFDRIQSRDEFAADYLSFMACIDPRNIPQSLLPPGTSRKKELEALGTLTAYSFVQRRPDDTLDLHRLVHLATRNWLRKEKLLAKSIDRAISRLVEVFPPAEHEFRAVWRKYIPHATYALENDVIDPDDNNIRTDLLWKLASCLEEEGQYDKAEEGFLKVSQIRQAVLGPEHPETLTSVNSLASVYREKGHWDQAEELELQVMETRTRLLGPEDPDTLTSVNNLASTYREKGKYSEAERLGLQVIEARKRVLGPEHPDTLSSISNLASTYWNLRNFDKAEALELQVLAVRKRVLGPDHPDTLCSICNLASTYWDQGRWSEAEELEVQELGICTRVLGEEHPDTLVSMNNLAFTWMSLGRREDAIGLMKKCVELRTRVLGERHPHTVSSRTELESWMCEEGQKEGA